MTSSRTRSRPTRALLACTALLAAGTAATPARATFPSDNGRIFFEQGKNVYSANPDGSGKKIAARASWWTGSPNLREPAPSPDAKRLAVSPGGRDIYVVKLAAPASSPTKLKNVTGKVSDNLTLTHLQYPSWSPDGKKLVFQAVRKNSAGYFRARIYRINLDGTGLKQLVLFDGLFSSHESRPDWGPTGRIAFNFKADLWTMKPDGTDKKNLTDCEPENEDCGFTDPSWSPDGTKIAVDLAVDGYPFPDTLPGIAAIDASTGEVIMSVSGNETYGSEKFDAPTWSPDGTQIAFFGFDDDADDAPYDLLTAPVQENAPITNLGVSDDLSGPDVMYPAWAASEAAAG